MCTRINNLTCLLDILPSLQLKVANAVDLDSVNHILDDFKSSRTTPNHVSDRSTVASPLSHTSSTPHTRRSTCSTLPPAGPFDSCVKHIKQSVEALLCILAYKVNLFVHEALNLLLYLEIPWDTPVEERLQPLAEFLRTHLAATSKWLSLPSFRSFTEHLWMLIVENFEREVDHLKRCGVDTEIQAEIMLNCVAFLIKFMNNDDHGLSLELLVTKADNVLFCLQLYTHPTNKLLALYYQVLAVHSGLETNNLNLSELPPKEYLEKMRHELHSVRKCFSGRQLVEWMLINGIEQDDISDLSGHMSPDLVHSKDYILGVAQTLLDKGLLVSVDEDLVSNADGYYRKFSFPKLTEYARPHSAFIPSRDRRDTEFSITSAGDLHRDHGVSSQRCSEDDGRIDSRDLEETTESHHFNGHLELLPDTDTTIENTKVCQTCGTNSRPRASSSFNQSSFSGANYETKFRHKSEPSVCQKCLKSAGVGEDRANPDSGSPRQRTLSQEYHPRSATETPETSGYKSATSHMTSDERLSSPNTALSSDGSDASYNPQHFYCSRSQFYRFSSIQDENVDYSSMKKTNLAQFIERFRQFPIMRAQLPSMLQSCREKNISPKFLLTIVYTRMKTDDLAQAFMQMLPKEVMLDIKDEPSIFGCWWP